MEGGGKKRTRCDKVKGALPVGKYLSCHYAFFHETAASSPHQRWDGGGDRKSPTTTTSSGARTLSTLHGFCLARTPPYMTSEITHMPAQLRGWQIPQNESLRKRRSLPNSRNCGFPQAAFFSRYHKRARARLLNPERTRFPNPSARYSPLRASPLPGGP